MNRLEFKATVLAVASIIAVVPLASAQSFYSQRGIGLVHYFVSGQSAGMGGAGLAVSDKLTLNYLNPAALVNLPVTFISGNFKHESANLSSESQKAAITNSNVAGVQFHVPLRKERISLALGLTPFSEIEYSFQSSGAVAGEPFTEILQGDGGVNTAFLTMAVRPFRRVSIGVSGLFYFGSLRSIWRVLFRDQSGLLNTHQEVSQNFTAGSIRVGAQVEILSGFRIGGVYSPAVTLNTNKAVTLENVRRFSDLEDQDIDVPQAYGFGVSFFLNRKLLLAADYYVQQWSGSNLDGYANDSRRIGLGFEFSGRGNRVNSSYWSRTALRAGVYYMDLGLEDPVGERVTEMFGSVGLGLPIKWSAGRLDLALEFGRRGSLSDNPVSENVIRFSASATVGERWFYRGGPR